MGVHGLAVAAQFDNTVVRPGEQASCRSEQVGVPFNKITSTLICSHSPMEPKQSSLARRTLAAYSLIIYPIRNSEEKVNLTGRPIAPTSLKI